MTYNAAKFKIQGTASEHAVTGNRYYIAAHLENCAITLEQPISPALHVTYEVFSSGSASPDQPLASKAAADLTFVESGTATVTLTIVNNTVHLIMPAADVASWVVRCTAALPEGSHVWERTIAIPLTVPAVVTVRKTTPAETNQYEARGWSDTLNDMVTAIAGIGTFANMDETYNTFGLNPAIVVVDNAQGQGDLRFMLTGAFSLGVDLTATTGVVDGFHVYDAAGQYHRLTRIADGQIVQVDDLQSVSIDAVDSWGVSVSAGWAGIQALSVGIEATATGITIDANTLITIDAGSLIDVDAITDIDIGAGQDLSLVSGASFLIQAGADCKINAVTSMTIESGTTLAIYHSADATIYPAGNTSVNIDLTSCTGVADGFQVFNGADSFSLLFLAADKITAALTCETLSIASAVTTAVTAGSQLNMTSSGADMLLTTPGNTVDFASLAAVNSAEAATHYVAMKVSGVLYHFLLATPPA